MVNIDKLIIQSIKEKDKDKTNTYRLIKAKMLEAKTAKLAKPYTEDFEISLLSKMVKERKDSAKIYKENNREDLALEDLKQADIISELLPEEATNEEIEEAIKFIFPEGIKQNEFGKAIQLVKVSLSGKIIDGKTLADIVKSFVVK